MISLFAALLTFAAIPAKNQSKQKPTRADMALQSAQRRAAPSKSSATAKQKTPRKSARVEISASRQRVHGREIAGFSARQAPTAEEENLTPPAGLKPVEQEAWVAMARRQSEAGKTGFASFYPAHYGEPFVVEGQGVRVAVRPVGRTDVTAQIDNSQVMYRNAYPVTDSMHVVSAGRSEEFLFLQNECAPREFAYELSELSAGTRIELVNGEVRFTNKSGHGVKIEAPWLVESNGVRRTDVVHWELDAPQKGSGPQRLRLVVADGLRYPAMIDPSWTLTGSLNDARSAHTATLLPNGQVLVAGGDSTSGILNSAELYNPATGTWTVTGSLHDARAEHTATLLLNGKVLVAGGRGAAFNSNSAELYDPTSGTWTLTTGSLNYPRFDHTATLLQSGEVLVAGGASNSPSGTSSAELYHPTTGMWTLTGSLNGGQGRREHTATLLPSGQVLVAGGFDYNGGVSLSSAELYNPETGIWTATGSLNEARDFFTATLLHTGKVLVAGGTQTQLRSAELYDPTTGIWTATGSLGNGRTKYTATLLPSGKVLVAGGSNFNDCELYDPASGTWGPTDSLNDGRGIHTATLLSSDTVLVAGGEGEFVLVLNSAELYASACGGLTFTNPTSIAINDVGIHPVPASPYPSNIFVGGMPGSIAKVTVKLNNITHTRPADIDMLLIGPDGQTTAIIMSDSGGSAPSPSPGTPTPTPGITNVTLTLDDLAANPLPGASPAPLVTTGVYRPTNNPNPSPSVPDTFPSPCPINTPSGSAALSAFNGLNPNGTWSLYIVDDQGVNAGNIAGGWELTIATDACPSPTPTPTATATATATFTPTPTATATDTPTPTATSTATATDTPTPTATSTATATDTPTPTATATATATDTPTPTATATATATDTPTPTATATATATDTPTPTATATATATDTPTPTATATATATDTPTPTATATASATATATSTPTPTPSATVSQMTVDGTNCATFSGGTATTLNTVTYQVDDHGKTKDVKPPKFMYWVKVTAAAGSNTFAISQSIATGNFNTQFKLDGGGNVFKGSDCKAAGGTNMTQNTSNGTNSTVTVRFNAQQAGVYYIAVKFQTGSVGGHPAPAPGTTVHYDFSTTGVPGSTSSVDLVKQ